MIISDFLTGAAELIDSVEYREADDQTRQHALQWWYQQSQISEAPSLDPVTAIDVARQVRRNSPQRR